MTHYGWRVAFWAPALLCIVGAFWLLNRLTDSPESMGLPPVEIYHGGATAGSVADVSVPFWGVFRATSSRTRTCGW